MRRRWKALLWFLGMLGVAAITLPAWLPLAATLAEPWIRERVLAIADDLLEPRVEVGHFEYHYPLGVEIVDLKLVSKGPEGEDVSIIEAGNVGIVLDSLPLTGAIVFRDFTLEKTTLRFHATRAGDLVGWSDLLTGDDTAGKNARPVSEIFAIDRILVNDLDVEYAIEGDDRRMNLDDLSFEVDNKSRQGEDKVDLGRGPGWYEIDTKIQRPDLFDIAIDGGLDIDTLDAELKSLDLDLVIDQDAVGHLPPQIQDLITNRRIEGRLDAKITGTFNLDDPRRDDTRFNVDVKPSRFAVDDYLVEVDGASVAGRFEDEVLRIDPCRVDLFGGHLVLDLKVADEIQRGLPGGVGTTDDPSTSPAAPNPATESSNAEVQARVAAARNATDGLVPEAAFKAAAKAATGIHASGWIEIEDIQLNRIHRVDQDDPDKIAGVVDSTIEFDFNVGRPLRTLGGGGQLQVTDGRFTGGPLVKALAGVMRIMTLSPTQKDRLEATFILRDEQVDVTSFSALAGPIGARGTGTIGIADRALDLRMNAGPLEGLQATTGRLGDIFGMLTDRLATYIVQGTLGDPQVRVAPLGVDIF